MKIKNILLASMIAGASVFGSSAFAADLNKTVIANLTSDGDSGFNAHFGDSFSSATTGSTFSDIYQFTLSGNYDSSASLTSTYLDARTVKDLLITGYSLVKYDPLTGNAITTYTGIGSVVTDANGTPTDTWGLSATGLTAGSYYVEVDGKVIGNGGGTYGSDLTISVSAVPEPETYGMFAAGLGLLGFVARRKKAKQA
jgi:hypothetical protein